MNKIWPLVTALLESIHVLSGLLLCKRGLHTQPYGWDHCNRCFLRLDLDKTEV